MKLLILSQTKFDFDLINFVSIGKRSGLPNRYLQDTNLQKKTC